MSEGCRNCYAETVSHKWGWTTKPWTAAHAAENVTCKPDRLAIPSKWRKPRRVFVNSMSDLFHEEIPPDYRARIFRVMEENPRHDFQVLTKRPNLAAAWPGPWAENIWLGVSVEDRKNLSRLDILREIPAAVKFVSFEPLLEDLEDVNLEGIDWAIVGGESGTGWRPMDHAWARRIRDAALRAGAAFLFKQSAAHRSGTRPFLEERDGSSSEWKQFPPTREPIRDMFTQSPIIVNIKNRGGS